MNYYTNGSVDFTTDVTSIVRELSMIAILALVFGVATGAALGLTCNTGFKTSTPSSTSGLAEYEEEVSTRGLVVVERSGDGTSYKLTDLGRRFLREYRFLDKPDIT
jgi:hypothetical protein